MRRRRLCGRGKISRIVKRKTLPDLRQHCDISGYKTNHMIPKNRKITVHSIQNDAPWNLDRLDQRRKRDLDGKYNNGGFTGSGVTVFILDNGMSASHEEFEGRVTDCISFVDGNEGCSDGSGEDAHGTHVGGIVGGKMYGVAKGVNLVNVKVLSRDGGSTASSIDGLEYVAEQKRLNPNTPMVANLSFGGIRSRAENAAVDSAVDAGVVVVVAAGNAFIPACWSSPASAKKSIAVAATNRRDWKPLFSNWGRCVSIFAPGVGILSALPDSDTASDTFDGTSQAAPHVAGAAALYLERDPTMTPGQVLKVLENDAKRCVLFRGFLSPKIMLNLEALV